MTYAFSSTLATDADFRDYVRTALTTAGWSTTTNANPYTSTIDYYVYKSPAASNSANVDWFVAVWMDTTNHRVAIMPFQEFSDVATPTYRKFCPGVSATPGGDGYHQQAAAAIGAFTGTPGGLVLERSTGSGTILIRVTMDAIVVASKSSAGTRYNGYCGFPEYTAQNTERPGLMCVSGTAALQLLNTTYPATMAATLPVASQGVSVARDTVPGILGANTNFAVCATSVNYLLNQFASGTPDSVALRDGYDSSKVLTWDYLVFTEPNGSIGAAAQPKTKLWGKLRDCVTASGLQPDIGDLLTIGGVSYRCWGMHSTNYQRAIYVKAT